MPKIIRGTKDLGGNVTLRGSKEGMRKLRCQSCHGYATEQRLPNGSLAYVCTCGAKYKVTAM